LGHTVVVLAAAGWIYLRLGVFSESMLPLTYVLPLLVCVWTRRIAHVWSMAAAFALAALAKPLWVLPVDALPRSQDFAYLLSTLANIVVGAAVVHLVVRHRNRLDAHVDAITRQNAELEAQAEELARRNEEIHAQSEEIAQQNEEIESQAEESSRQNEDLRESNERLGRRDLLLQAAVQSLRAGIDGRAALAEFAREVLAILGSPAVALAVLEKTETDFELRAQAASTPDLHLPERWPAAESLAALVLECDRTAAIDDLAKRPDLALLGPGRDEFRSVLMTPLRATGGESIGILAACSRAPTAWTEEQFQLLEWIATQCGLIVESLKWQADLRRRTEALQAAHRAKDEFLAMLSHELRTPLTPVLAAAHVWEDVPELPDDLRSDLGMIRRSVTVQSRLIDDLLDVTRVSRGKIDLAFAPVDVLTLVRESAAVVSADLLAKHQTLKLELDLPTGTRVAGDDARLQQIVWNLLKNAVKFGPEHSEIVLGARVVSPPAERRNDPTNPPASAHVEITVTDRGIGISAADLQRIFTPFEQAATHARQGGLGLGLSIAKVLAEMHGGSLTAASEGVGRGATFTVALPLAKAAQPVDDTLSPALDPPDPKPTFTAPSGNGTKARILLVEDHEDTARILRRFLEREGHPVVYAATHADALASAARDDVQLVLSDLGLPDGNGLDLFPRLRELRPRVRGICMSGFGMESDLAASRAAGFDEHLVKPIDIRRLRELLARFAAQADAEA
jgi:signal transduction histidine kinase/CheY-like chemotaxis protein